MSSKRRIWFSRECEQADVLGGFQRLDPGLDAIWDGLHRNPFGFDVFETDCSNSARFAVTRPVGRCPKLVWMFRIDDNKDVEIIHVENLKFTEQSERFKQTARELGVELDEDKLKQVLRKMREHEHPKPSARDPKGTDDEG